MGMFNAVLRLVLENLIWIGECGLAGFYRFAW